MGQSRIPQALAAFDVYIRRVAVFLATIISGTTTNGNRLGLSDDEVAGSTDILTSWYTGNPASPGAYEQHTNENTKTKTTRNTVVEIVKDYTTYMNPLLTRMSTSPALTESDRTMLNLPARDATATPRGAIEVTPVVGITSLSGGRLKIRTRISTDATRASMHPLADGVELRYQVGGTQPATALNCANIVVSTKAMFTVEAGIENGEKKFYGFARYVNQSNLANSGPWGSLNISSVQS